MILCQNSYIIPSIRESRRSGMQIRYWWEILDLRAIFYTIFFHVHQGHRGQECSLAVLSKFQCGPASILKLKFFDFSFMYLHIIIKNTVQNNFKLFVQFDPDIPKDWTPLNPDLYHLNQFTRPNKTSIFTCLYFIKFKLP